MAVQLTKHERAQMRKFLKRPRSRKQMFRTQALLALDDGAPISTVARQCRVGVERVEKWVERFEKERLSFLEESAQLQPPTQSKDDDDFLNAG